MMNKSKKLPGRPIKFGLEYFGVKCILDDKMDFLITTFGMLGYGIFISILRRIYAHEGYWCSWSDRIIAIFARNVRETPEKVTEVTNFCIEEQLFDRRMYEDHEILTSAEIQRTWLQIVKKAKRRGCSVNPTYNLITQSDYFSEELPFTREKNMINSGNVSGENAINEPILPAINTQRKEKRIKGNKGTKKRPSAHLRPPIQEKKDPTEEEVVEAFLKQCGTEDQAKKFYSKYAALGWQYNNQPIVNFRFLISRFMSAWEKNHQDDQNKQHPNSSLSWKEKQDLAHR
jgi:hypothetical protein